MIYFILSIKRNFLKKKISNFSIKLSLPKLSIYRINIIPPIKKYVSM